MSFINELVKEIHSKHGKESINKMDSKPSSVQRLSTQLSSLDLALGGGFPYGRITEVWGSEGSGKTTLALHVLSECQKQGGMPVIIDVEHALDFSYAEALGLASDKLLVSQPQSGDEAMKIASDLMLKKIGMETDKPLVIVIDSIAALTTVAEMEGDIADHQMAYLARFLSKVLKRLTPLISASGAVFVCLNQSRVNIGSYGNPEQSAGGKALKFYSSMRVQLTPGQKIMGDKGFDGMTVKIKAVKNKTFRPFLEAELELHYGKGFDRLQSLMDAGLAMGLIQIKGAWLGYGDERFNGKKKFKDAMINDPDLYDVLKSEVEVWGNKI